MTWEGKRASLRFASTNVRFAGGPLNLRFPDAKRGAAARMDGSSLKTDAEAAGPFAPLTIT